MTHDSEFNFPNVPVPENEPAEDKLFDDLFVIYGKLTAQGSIIELRGKIFERMNINPALLIGQKFSETVFWQASEQTPRNLETALGNAAKGMFSKNLLDFRVSADEKLFVELNLHPAAESVNDDQISFFAYDVTNQEQQIEFFRQRSEQLLFAAESAEIGLWSWNLQDNSVYSTPKCNQIFEVSPFDSIAYENFIERIHPEDQARVENILENSQATGSDFHEKFRVICGDGKIEWISAEGKTFLDENGQPLKMMGVVFNVSDQKHFEEELEKINDREKKARDDAEIANRSKDFFLAFVSHELRSPLNAILGWSKILLSKSVDETTQRTALETIERSARAQAKLINDLVDSARIASGKLRLEFRPVNLNEIIESVYQTQKPTADSKNLNLNIEPAPNDVPVVADSVRLQQVFNNLVSNSIKFTPSGGNISISLQTDSAKVSVKVADDGQGINPDSLPFIFNQFSQANSNENMNKQGLGLGLSIVKILVEKHNGTVQVESRGLGFGTTFTVYLPLSNNVGVSPEENIAEVASSPQDSKSLDQLRIFLVEDDEDSREVLGLFLEQYGATVQSAASAAEAVEFFDSEYFRLPDLIISDLAMPREDGYSLIRRIRNFPAEKGGKIPAIALSAFATAENKRKAFESGFQKYSTKPFDPDVLINEILNLLNDYQS